MKPILFNTGMEPEEVFALQMHPDHAFADYVKNLWKQIGGMDRMEQLAKAEAEGRLLVLPCEFGADIFTVVTTDRSRGARACPRPVKWVRSGQLTWNNLRSVLSEFGKTVFLTREEAEAALRGGADR